MTQWIRLNSFSGETVKPCEHITLGAVEDKDLEFPECEYKIPLRLACNVCLKVHVYNILIG